MTPYSKIIPILLAFFVFTYLNGQVVAVDEYCISNTFVENGEMNERPLYGPVAGVYVYWDESDKWILGSLDQNYVYYTSEDNSVGPGCSGTFNWTAPSNSECENVAISGTSCSIILPVEYVYLKGSREVSVNNIKWKTASEINNEGFEIQRSNDGVLFSKIGFVNGKGTTSFSYDYNFIDRNISEAENYFYRLIQRDYDGHFEVSQIIYISGSRSISILDFTTWENNYISLYANKKADDVSLMLLDMSGRRIYNSKVSISSGKNSFLLPDLPSGIYVLSISEGNSIGEYIRITKQ